MTTSAFRAELVVMRSHFDRPFHFLVNGGCDLIRKVSGTSDSIAEQLQVQLLNGDEITAKWVPQTRRDGTSFVAAFAGWKNPSGEVIRWDNAGEREQLHIDARYRGVNASHGSRISLADLRWIDRRRLRAGRALEGNCHNRAY